MALDEGYLKYESQWTAGEAPDKEAAHELETWRAPLFAAGLIGHYQEHDIGYGNISVRHGNCDQFIISGTQTGHLQSTSPEHYSLVTSCDIGRNRVDCCGPVQASSETMTHAAIYALSASIRAVVHVHSRSLWDRYLHQLPTTRADAAYGTPQMAREFRRLYLEGEFSRVGLAVMAGHDEGLVSIGETLEEAASRVLALLAPSRIP